MSKDKGQPSNVLLLRMQKIKQKIWKGLKKWQLGNTMHLETCLVSLDTHPLADKPPQENNGNPHRLTLKKT